MATKKEVWVSSKGDTYQTELGALLGEQSDLFCDYTDHDQCEYVIPKLTGELVAAIDALHEYAHRGDKAPSDAKVETGVKLRVGGVYLTREGKNTIEIFRRLDAEDDEGPIEDGYSFEGRVIAGSDPSGTTYYYSASGEFCPDEPDPDDLASEVIHPPPATVLPEGVPPELDDWVKRWEWITARVTEDQVRELREGDEVRIGARWCEVTERDGDGVWVGIVRYLQTEFEPRELAAIANEVRYNGR